MTTINEHTADTVKTPELTRGGARWRMVLKRALQFSFLFFLLKGLAWLAVGFVAWRGLT